MFTFKTLFIYFECLTSVTLFYDVEILNRNIF